MLGKKLQLCVRYVGVRSLSLTKQTQYGVVLYCSKIQTATEGGIVLLLDVSYTQINTGNPGCYCHDALGATPVSSHAV